MAKDFEYDLMVYIGRFQPFHNGHLLTLQYAFQKARRVIVLVGSHKSARSIRNPWTTEERMEMIRSVVGRGPVDSIQDKLILAELEDYTYNDEKWIARVQEIVNGLKAVYGTGGKIGITGFDKDSSSYYLKIFPQWEVCPPDNHEPLDATDMRNLYFDSGTILSGKLPQGVVEWLVNWKKTEEYKKIKEEFRVIKDYKKSWEVAPYAPIFVTVDAVVIQAGHTLGG